MGDLVSDVLLDSVVSHDFGRSRPGSPARNHGARRVGFSRPGVPVKRDPYLASSYVIDTAHKLPWPVRARDVLLTIIIWCVYFYFMKATIAFVHDAAIWISHGFDDFSRYPGLKTLPDIVSFIKMGFGLASLLIAWSYYNIIRYGRRTRRRQSVPIEIERIADAYEVN